MSDDIWLGKITRAEFGFGGYQEAMLGLSLTFSGSGRGVGTFSGAWDFSTKVTEHTRWTEEDREVELVGALRLLSETLRMAKVQHVAELVGKPVEVHCGVGQTIESWRILEEVL